MKTQNIRTTGMVFPDTSIIEMVFDPLKDKTGFVVFSGNRVTVCDKYEVSNKTYLPYGEANSLIKNKIVLLPSKATEYGTKEQLVAELVEYIHKYVDLDPVFEKLCAHYVLLSWVYDGFNQLPYIRKCGDFGTGKTRFLTVVGSVCYKPIFASGSSSTAALFHILDKFRGTLLLDEADFRYTDEKADLVKVLNNGFSKGYPVLRCAYNKNMEFDPVGYQVYGCKLVAARKHFDDPALESRFITEQRTLKPLREDVPTDLPEAFEDQAQQLRNKLLLFRLKSLGKVISRTRNQGLDGVEPRVNQIFSSLLNLAIDTRFERELISLAKQTNKQLLKDRALLIECHVLTSIHALIENQDKVSIGDITNRVQSDFGDFYQRKITAKWIGYVVSKILCLRTYKSGGRFYLSENQLHILEPLYERYGVG